MKPQLGITFAATATFLALGLAVRSGSWLPGEAVKHVTATPVLSVALVGKSLATENLEFPKREGSRVAYLVLMPSCSSCQAKSVNTETVVRSASHPVIFLYPDELSKVPSSELPIQARSLVADFETLRGVPTNAFLFAPTYLLISSEWEIVAQSSPDESFENFQARVSSR